GVVRHPRRRPDLARERPSLDRRPGDADRLLALRRQDESGVPGNGRAARGRVVHALQRHPADRAVPRLVADDLWMHRALVDGGVGRLAGRSVLVRWRSTAIAGGEQAEPEGEDERPTATHDDGLRSNGAWGAAG